MVVDREKERERNIKTKRDSEKLDILERGVPGQLWLSFLQDLDYVWLPQKCHYLVIVCWRQKEDTFINLQLAYCWVWLNSPSLTHRHHILVLTSGAAKSAGGAGHDGWVGLARVIHYLWQMKTQQFSWHPISETDPHAGAAWYWEKNILQYFFKASCFTLFSQIPPDSHSLEIKLTDSHVIASVSLCASMNTFCKES